MSRVSVVTAIAAGCLASTPALAQGGTYTRDPGLRVPTGSIPEIVFLHGVYRLYYCDSGIVSAVSLDGLDFSLEPGVRVAAGAPGSQEEIVCDPSIVLLPDGRVRMYYKGADGPGGPGQSSHRIFSAVSSDGITFVKEGLRFENPGHPDYGWTSVPDAAMLPDGRTRIYYVGGSGVLGGGERFQTINSAVSTDGLSFVREPGARIPRGVDPDVVVRPNGTLLLFYGESGLPPMSLAVARSTDGLVFSAIGTILPAGGPYDSEGTLDPSAIRLPDGRYRVYYHGRAAGQSWSVSATSPSPVPRPPLE